MTDWESPSDNSFRTLPAENASGAKAVVIVPVLPRHFSKNGDDGNADTIPLTPDARLEEAVGLAAAIELDVVHSETAVVNAPRPGTLIGTGKVDEVAALVKEMDAELVVVDHQLSPVQQRNLEKAFKAKVLDRTGLILEIFGRRARTKEGRLQVDLAHLEYQRGRLVRSWTHLERQRGGGGFMGGPGETQIEADRRLLQERIVRIKRELETVRRTRDLHRAKRQKVPFPVVAIVGYTNAGKSTLFNRLTGASVMAEDMLFATLDPTLRRVRFPHGTIAILSDTVGFISDLPTHLVAAFRATLEEVVEADFILHVRDISDPNASAHAANVQDVLKSLGVDVSDDKRIIEVLNKIDLLDEGANAALEHAQHRSSIAISAISGQGLDALLEEIEKRVAGVLEEVTIQVAPSKMGVLDWIYRNSQVLKRKDNDDGSITLKLRATELARQEITGRLS